MKIYAHYDTEGTIHALILINAPDGFGAMVAPEPGLLVAEVEGLQLKSAAPHVEELRKIAKTYKVATPQPRSKLVKIS